MTWAVGDPPPVLRTARLVLDQPAIGDVDAIVEHCRDPLFESVMLTPWPYEREHAVGFVEAVAAGGWASGDECTWALRERDGGPLIGAIGWRAERCDVGYWLGALHRGRGFMTEALRAVDAWVFAERGVPTIAWWTTAGHTASAATARAAGFRFTGTGDGWAPERDGRTRPAWFAELRRDDDPLARHHWPVL